MRTLRTPLHDSGCAINVAVEELGDPWAMLRLRDIIFGNRRYFRELVAGCEEGIATHILASRLKQLVAAGLLTREAARDEDRCRRIGHDGDWSRGRAHYGGPPQSATRRQRVASGFAQLLAAVPAWAEHFAPGLRDALHFVRRSAAQRLGWNVGLEMPDQNVSSTIIGTGMEPDSSICHDPKDTAGVYRRTIAIYSIYSGVDELRLVGKPRGSSRRPRWPYVPTSTRRSPTDWATGRPTSR